MVVPMSVIFANSWHDIELIWQGYHILVGGFNHSEKYSVGMSLPNIWKNKSRVPNHQPDIVLVIAFGVREHLKDNKSFTKDGRGLWKHSL